MDGQKWTPAEVRGLVNDVCKWLFLAAALFLGVDAKLDAVASKAGLAQAQKELDSIREELGSRRFGKGE